MDADATRLVFNILSTGFSTTVVENVVLEGQKKRDARKRLFYEKVFCF